MKTTRTVTAALAAVTVTSLMLAGCTTESTGTLGTDWDTISEQAQTEYEHVQSKSDADLDRDRDSQRGENWDSQPETERVEVVTDCWDQWDAASIDIAEIPSEFDITSEPEEPFRFMSATAAPNRFPYPGEDTSDWVCVDSPDDPQICVMTPPEELR
ncbi:hypothetical protein I3U40_18165 [Mycobacteroides abscessus subsp. abscessus]|uniref:hypothetical protein n=1 Tax=Mycobacteroides abscessus TaxID=36809 RepID=UPI0009A6685A|nr:hypothetical protein [Mycobacteroides abscessus]QSM92982.1 hypothetical protein I3U31_18155 [Mycobacteroides abscessus subsp. abscessus]QSM98020.1 hypothetical protein I3U40_18165 [Mycobacteroides abscessus subsp. abscessus]SLI41033.1 Uncharacterised protein [Mycobacteroides abscessus subsp. abscessus]